MKKQIRFKKIREYPANEVANAKGLTWMIIIAFTIFDVIINFFPDSSLNYTRWELQLITIGIAIIVICLIWIVVYLLGESYYVPIEGDEK